MKNTVRINFEFPKSEYPHLKMICASLGKSLREFATEIMIRAIEEAEDEMLNRKAKTRHQKMKKKDLISWDEALHLAGWNDESL